METLYLVGSRMLKLDNCHDTDFICFDKNFRLKEDNCHFLHSDVNTVNHFFGSILHNPEYKLQSMVYFYQFSKCFHPEPDYPIKWCFTEHKREWIASLKSLINNSRTEMRYQGQNGLLRKELYNVAYQYFMLAENKVWLDGESKAIVQKIHDCEMPNSYFYELRDKINNLKIEE